MSNNKTIANRFDRLLYTVTITHKAAVTMGLVRCSCGHPENNHFDFDACPCAHCACKQYDPKVSSSFDLLAVSRPTRKK